MTIPVLVFAYKRPSHLKQCLDALAKCDDLEKFTVKVIVDGPKPTDSFEEIFKSRQVASCHSIVESVIFNEVNLGLSSSIVGGVTETLKENSRVIVLEDDLIVNTFFLKFMSWGLSEYCDVMDVASIQGYTPQPLIPRQNPYFMRGADCWGWATWQNRWCDFELDPNVLINSLRAQNLTKRFDCYGLYPYTKMLQDNLEGRNDSWAIRWHATNFLLNKYSVYPPKTLVMNFGNDGSGTHSKQSINKSRQRRTQNINFTNWKLPTALPPSRISATLSLTSFLAPFISRYIRHIRYGFVKRLPFTQSSR